MTRARMLFAAFMLPLALAAGGDEPPPAWQGYVEGEFLFLGPEETGRVTALLVEKGDEVTGGAPLFAVDDSLERAQRDEAAASLATQQAAIARLEAASQRPEEIAVLRAEEEAALAALALSQSEYDRQAALQARGNSSVAALDAARSARDRDRARLEEVRSRIAVALLPAHELDIAAARERVKAAEAGLALAEARLARRAVEAPADALVQEIYRRPGEVAPAGQPVVALLPPAGLKLRFYVPQAALPSLTPGDGVTVTCDGCQPQQARIVFIAPEAEYTPPVIYSLQERQKLVFLVEALPEAPEALRVGQPVEVRLR